MVISYFDKRFIFGLLLKFTINLLMQWIEKEKKRRIERNQNVKVKCSPGTCDRINTKRTPIHTNTHPCRIKGNDEMVLKTRDLLFVYCIQHKIHFDLSAFYLFSSFLSLFPLYFCLTSSCPVRIYIFIPMIRMVLLCSMCLCMFIHIQYFCWCVI